MELNQIKREPDSPVSSTFTRTTISQKKSLQQKSCKQIDWNKIDERETSEYLWKEVEALSCLDPPQLSGQVFTSIKPNSHTEVDVLKEEVSWLNEEFYKDQQDNSSFCLGLPSTIFTPETLVAGLHFKTHAQSQYSVPENRSRGHHPRDHQNKDQSGANQKSGPYDYYQSSEARQSELSVQFQQFNKSHTLLPTRFVYSNGVLTDAHSTNRNDENDFDIFRDSGEHPPKVDNENPFDVNNNHDDSVNHENTVMGPRRPKNGFMRYSIACRQIIAAERPRLDNREISRILGSRWRKMSAEERKPYELEFAKDIATIREQNPEWRYAPAKKFTAELVEPMPSRLRPREKLKRNIPALVRPYRRKRPRIYKTKDDLSTALVQCSTCGKWRKLPSCVKLSDIHSNWKCDMNPDVVYNACWIPDEWIISSTSSQSTTISTNSQSVVVQPSNFYQPSTNQVDKNYNYDASPNLINLKCETEFLQK